MVLIPHVIVYTAFGTWISWRRAKRQGIIPEADSVAGHVFVVWIVSILSGATVLPEILRSSGPCHQHPAAAACKMYVEAQEIYHRTDYNGDGVLEYAQRFSGKDSLIEKTSGAFDLALVDRSFAAAEDTQSNPQPKAGYLFRILTAQSKHANGGAKSYIAEGRMTQGYALVAYPALYDGTGRDTFIISHHGTIYQADLGRDTQSIVDAMTEFDPDPKIWVPTE